MLRSRFAMTAAAALAIVAAFALEPAETRAQEAEDAAVTPSIEARADRVFQRLDSNGDGGVSRTEAQFKRQQRFARLDRNADGALTLEEYMTPLDRRFQVVDANGDGSISREELAQAIANVDRGGME